MKNKKRAVIAAVISAAVILIAAPYLKVEYLTEKHGGTFAELYHSIGLFEEIEYLKVMDYSESKAEVYYVVSEKAAGVLAEFESRSDSWELAEWETVWSSSGSADGFIWPYYR